MATRYKDICAAYKCKFKVFTQMPADFESKIGTPDLLIVFTGTYSHKMLGGVKKHSKRSGTPVKHLHSSSVSALKNLLSEYDSK